MCCTYHGKITFLDHHRGLPIPEMLFPFTDLCAIAVSFIRATSVTSATGLGANQEPYCAYIRDSHAVADRVHAVVDDAHVRGQGGCHGQHRDDHSEGEQQHEPAGYASLSKWSTERWK